MPYYFGSRFITGFTINSGHNGLSHAVVDMIIDDDCDIQNIANIEKEDLFPGKVVIKCQYCGQWAARKTACKHCGGAVE